MEIIPKPKRKYTRKIKISNEPYIGDIEHISPKLSSPIDKPISKPKRKYTKKHKNNISVISVNDETPIPNDINIKKDIENKAKNTEISNMENIKSYKTVGFSFLEKQSKSTIEGMITLCKNEYYNNSKSLI